MSHQVKSHSLSYFNITECPGGYNLMLKIAEIKIAEIIAAEDNKTKTPPTNDIPMSLETLYNKLDECPEGSKVEIENSNVIPLFKKSKSPKFSEFVIERITENIFLELYDILEYIEAANIEDVNEFKDWSKHIDGETLINMAD